MSTELALRPQKKETNQCNAARNGCLACLVHSFCDNLFGIKKQLGRKILRGGVPLLGEQKLANGNWHGRNHGLRQSVLASHWANKNLRMTTGMDTTASANPCASSPLLMHVLHLPERRLHRLAVRPPHGGRKLMGPTAAIQLHIQDLHGA